MSAAVCPYCRTAIESPIRASSFLCTGCGTPHHADCYTENGGCTVFGCSAAPADEQKVSVTRHDIASPITSPAPAPTAGNLPQMLPGIGLTPPGWKPERSAEARESCTASVANRAPSSQRLQSCGPSARVGVGSMFFDAPPVPVPAAAAASFFDFDLEPDPNAKNRSTFIVLGALLGFFGAHNFLRRVQTQGRRPVVPDRIHAGIRRVHDLGVGRH